jgi:predicted dehydrogenase
VNADRKLRVGVIGGGYGRNHILAYRASGVEVAAFCQRSKEAAAAPSRTSLPITTISSRSKGWTR